MRHYGLIFCQVAARVICISKRWKAVLDAHYCLFGENCGASQSGNSGYCSYWSWSACRQHQPRRCQLLTDEDKRMLGNFADAVANADAAEPTAGAA